MKNLMKKTRKGFTLIELLIAIIILGALASTMMLSAGNSVAAAKANTIISNMVTVKDAAVMYYSSYYRSATIDNFKEKASDYLGDFSLNKKQGSAEFDVVEGTGTGNETKWYVQATINDNVDAAAIKDYLEKSASKSQLIKTKDGSGAQYTKDQNILYMQIK